MLLLLRVVQPAPETAVATKGVPISLPLLMLRWSREPRGLSLLLLLLLLVPCLLSPHVVQGLEQKVTHQATAASNAAATARQGRAHAAAAAATGVPAQ